MRLLIVYVLAFTIVCFTLKACVLVKGGYLVQVRLNGYSNPTGKCGHSSQCHGQSGQLYCCDNLSNSGECRGNERCDSYFKYCLRPFGEVRLDSPRCLTNQERATSLSNPNDRYLDFSQSRVLGLDNPQRLPGLDGAYNRVQLYIEIGDKDGDDYKPDELVDILLVNLSLTVAESYQQNYAGIYNLVMMDLTITVLCEDNFEGSNCTQCVSGFIGTNCDKRDYCHGVDCSGNGECSNNYYLYSFECTCAHGFTGETCQININECHVMEVNCNGNGQCVDGVNSFHCICDPDFTGEFCQTNIDDCMGVDCSGKGQCVDGVNNFTCSCDGGFTGELCQTNIDDCVGVNCGNGQCVDGVNSFQCICDLGYTGEHCQSNINDCVGVNCSGNGQCVDGVNSFQCICDSGYTGEHCQSNINECVEGNCSENGRCVDGVSSFQCICDSGYTGEHCQSNINDCVGVNCSGNGRCVDGVNNYTCECTPGFSGHLCSEVDSSSGSNSSTGDGGNIGAIAGGVVGALLAVVILLILIVVMFVIISKYQQKSFKLREANNQGTGNSGNSMPGDNPVYEPGYTIIGGLLPHSTATGTTSPEREGSDSCVEERKFDNPIYGDGETDDSVYTVPYDQQDQQSPPNHEFDNPIYGTETYNN